jgi:radical SAM protein (TIGR01212 family)
MYIPYYSANIFFRERFGGEKIWKIPINAGFACPNKDGKISKLGCIYCDAYSSGPLKTFALSIEKQIEIFMKQRTEKQFIAYYQANSSTYAPIEKLKEKYNIIFKYKNIKGLFIGTRSDAIENETYALLDELNKKTYLCVELGLQSIHQKSLNFLNRNHSYSNFIQTFRKLKELNIDVVVHLIIGIPDETKEDMLKTVEQINILKPAGIKFHMLHLLKDTPLLELYKRKKFKLFEMEEYTDLIVYLLERLDKDIIIHRLTGERDKEIFVAPMWALKKAETIQLIQKKMIEANTYQGIYVKND